MFEWLNSKKKNIFEKRKSFSILKKNIFNYILYLYKLKVSINTHDIQKQKKKYENV